MSWPTSREVLDIEAADADATNEKDGDSVVDGKETNLLKEAAVEAWNENLKDLVKLEDNKSNQMQFNLEILDRDTKIHLLPPYRSLKTYAEDDKVLKF